MPLIGAALLLRVGRRLVGDAELVAGLFRVGFGKLFGLPVVERVVLFVAFVRADAEAQEVGRILVGVVDAGLSFGGDFGPVGELLGERGVLAGVPGEWSDRRRLRIGVFVAG